MPRNSMIAVASMQQRRTTSSSSKGLLEHLDSNDVAEISNVAPAFEPSFEEDLADILARQLQTLQQSAFDAERSFNMVASHERLLRSLQAELAEATSETERLRTQLANSCISQDGGTGSTMERLKQRTPTSSYESRNNELAVAPFLSTQVEESRQGRSPRALAELPAPLTGTMAAGSSDNVPLLPVDDSDIADDEPEPEQEDMSKEIMKFLKGVKLFKRFSEDELALLSSGFLKADFPIGHVLFTQGDIGKEFFVILEGEVSISVDGDRVTNLSSGNFFGEVSLLRNDPRNATVVAETALTVLSITREKFHSMGLHSKLGFEQRKVERSQKAVFADAKAMKEKLRLAMSKPPYDVANFYHTTGPMQRIARADLFDNITLSVIAFNALWIAVDTDYNGAEILLEAHPVFITMENFFCAYFFSEWVIRFCAFRRKRDCLRDAWFVFDSALVFTMVLETWIMTVVVLILGGAGSGGMGNASILRLFRLLRLSRMARMARLLRAMPELMVLIKGMVVAMRSVFFTLCLLGGIIYIFGITFVQLMKDTGPGDEYFTTVPMAMNSLLLQGTLPDQAGIVEGVGDEGFLFRIVILAYILLASLTVMNMLVGVLCEVVSVVSSVEKESMLVAHVRDELLSMLHGRGIDAAGGEQLNRHQFEALLETPGCCSALHAVGVDVVGLVDFTDFIFANGRELSFHEFMDLVLQLRGSNTATVKDVVDLRKSLVVEFERMLARSNSKTSSWQKMSFSQFRSKNDFMAHASHAAVPDVSPPQPACRQNAKAAIVDAEVPSPRLDPMVSTSRAPQTETNQLESRIDNQVEICLDQTNSPTRRVNGHRALTGGVRVHQPSQDAGPHSLGAA